MEFEWDESKNDSNIEKHGIDFDKAKAVFEGNVIRKEEYNEKYS